MGSDKYAFRRATIDDLPLLVTWQAQPHVRKWWDMDAPYSQKDIDEPRVSRWIVMLDGRAFAFMQDYTVHGWQNHHFANLPKGSRGIDQYIGDPAMVGAGHGSAFIRARMQFLFDAGAPVIATDPHPDNKRAISVYRKLGFEPVGPVEDTRWGLILPMLAKPFAQSDG
ncbi:GNAT family N-acetyltransferase [Roseobacter sp. CCS2]|uniref:GNAT family N-acetyltransferase n=1 Tax=Roseobacter sp. CCS2 TaxID=391593 RepID=UPI0000F40125|nr:GNAT family N-acetyltransferase [Roseobacter sp. CCS2]EBA14026.1 GCN5-related N-acetyltransferase [Roseobacter sp. CCS2]